MKNADSSSRMPEFDINTKLAEKLDSDILEKFGFGSSSLSPKNQNSFREWMATFLISKSPRMQEIIDIIEKISGVDVSVLITGEPGTGKELVAKTI
jgi:DNA-binding NtrC family response regulator